MAETEVITNPAELAKDAAKKVKRSKPVAPNEAEYKKKNDEITARITALEGQFKELRANTDEASIRATTSAQRDELFNKLKAIKAKKDELFTQRDGILEKIKKCNEEVDKKKDQLAKLRAGLKYKTADDIDKAVKELQTRLETEHFKAVEEKQMLNEISYLKKSKKQLVDFDAMKVAVNEELARRDVLKKDLSALYNGINAFKAEEDGLKAQLDEIKGKQDKLRADRTTLMAQKDAIKKDIDAAYTERRELNEKLKQEKQEYWNATREERELARQRREEERKARQAAIEAKREEQRRELEEWERTRDPYEEQKLAITNLLIYLQRFGGVAPAAEPAKEEDKKEADVRRPEIPAGAVVLKKKGDDEELDGFFSGSGKNKNKNKGKKNVLTETKSAQRLKHPLDVIESYRSLGLTLPATQGDVTNSVKELVEKKHYYETAPRPQKPAPVAEPEPEVEETEETEEAEPSDEVKAEETAVAAEVAAVETPADA
eukprot:Colp12_sorted_trinity150504_noHs@22912